MNRLIRVAWAGLGLILLGWFAYAHFDQPVNIEFGLFTIRGVPLSVVIYLSVIIGMLTVVGIAWRGDLRRQRPGADVGAAAEPAETSKEPSSMTSR